MTKQDKVVAQSTARYAVAAIDAAMKKEGKV